VKRKRKNQSKGDKGRIVIRLPREDQQRLRKVLSWMLYDPALFDTRERPNYTNAMRYALTRCLEHPPAHVEASGG
jgi:hypothetical protein